MSIAALSSEATQALFESGYVIPATAAVAASSNAANSDHIYAELGKLWAQTRRGLDALPPAQAHVPGEGRAIDEDLEDCVIAANMSIWASVDPRPMIGSTQLYNRPSSIRAKMATAAKAHEAQRAADRAAAEAHAHPPSRRRSRSPRPRTTRRSPRQRSSRAASSLRYWRTSRDRKTPSRRWRRTADRSREMGRAAFCPLRCFHSCRTSRPA